MEKYNLSGSGSCLTIFSNRKSQDNPSDSTPNKWMFRTEVKIPNIKSMIKNIQTQKNLDLSNFHKNTLLESFRSRNATTLTSTTSHLVSLKSHTDRSENENSKVKSKYFYQKISQSESKSMRKDYFSELSHLAKMNYFLKLKEEHKLENKEELNNKIENITETVNTFKKYQKLFHSYLERLDELIKYMRNRKEIETIKLSSLNFSLAVLKNEITNLKIKKEKITGDIAYMNDCQLFLICLKKNSINLMLLSKGNLKISNDNNSFLIGNSPTRRNGSIKFNSSQWLDGELYHTAEEVEKDLQNLQNKVFQLINVYNDNNEKLKNWLTISKDNSDNCEPGKANDIIELKEILRLLKVKNKKLLTQKEWLQNSHMDDQLSGLTDLQCQKIEKICMILKKESLINLSNKDNFKNYNCSIELISIFKNIESSVDFLLFKYNSIKDLNPTALNDFEKNIEKCRKVYLHENFEERLLFKNNELLKHLRDKHEKLIVKGRKISTKIKVIKKEKRKTLNLQKDEEKEFEEMISY